MRYESTVQAGRWYFGFTLRRFSVFLSWKCDRTFRNYGRDVLALTDGEGQTRTVREQGRRMSGIDPDEARRAILGLAGSVVAADDQVRAMTDAELGALLLRGGWTTIEVHEAGLRLCARVDVREETEA